MDREDLDALAYPTLRQETALIGAAPVGATCTLSAHSGLPALTIPAGFTESGLPVGLELLGRQLDDAATGGDGICIRVGGAQAARSIADATAGGWCGLRRSADCGHRRGRDH